MNGHETKPVVDYSHALNEVDSALEYPGERPNGSFLTDGNTVTILPNDYDGFKNAADKLLSEKGLPLIDERIPVLTYGANASPPRLQTKMKKFGVDIQNELQTVPHCVVTIADMAAVWHGRPGQTGSVFAELYNQKEVIGAQLTAHIAYMTREQLMSTHISEGATYSAAIITTEVGAGEKRHETDVIAYVAFDSQTYVEDGGPLLIAGLQHENTTLPKASAEGLVNKMLDESAQDLGLPDNARDFITAGLALSREERKARQAEVGDVLKRKGFLRPYVFVDIRDEAASGILIGRCDFASLPRQDHSLLQIPEVALQSMRPKPQEIDQKVKSLREKNPQLSSEEARVKAMTLIDPARMVSRRAHKELEVRIGKIKKV